MSPGSFPPICTSRHLRPPRPAIRLDQTEELEHGSVEERWLFEVDRVTTLRQHHKSGRWQNSFEEDRDIDARLVLVTNGDQRGNLQVAQRVLQREDRRPTQHHSQHGERLTVWRVPGHLLTAYRPAVRVLALER